MEQIFKSALKYFNLCKSAQINENDRITVSKKSEFDNSQIFLSEDEDHPHTNKPNAFYYAFGTQWIGEFVFDGNVYKLDLNMSKMYDLTKDNLNDFIKKYCTYVSSEEALYKSMMLRKMTNHGITINWGLVKRDYHGVEIKDLWSLKNKFEELCKENEYVNMDFLNTVDVDGGFFWNKSVINGAKKIAIIENGQIKYLEDNKPKEELKEPIKEELPNYKRREVIEIKKEDKKEKKKKDRRFFF